MKDWIAGRTTWLYPTYNKATIWLFCAKRTDKNITKIYILFKKKGTQISELTAVFQKLLSS
jgi:hypothetical protein